MSGGTAWWVIIVLAAILLLSWAQGAVLCGFGPVDSWNALVAVDDSATVSVPGFSDRGQFPLAC